jgi:hypothetical protein
VFAQHPVHDRREHVRQAWLHHEPIATGSTGLVALVLKRAPCQDNHRQVAGLRLALEHSRQAKPIHIAWQADGRDDYVRAQFRSQSEAVPSGGCLERAVALELEPLRVHLALIT